MAGIGAQSACDLYSKACVLLPDSSAGVRASGGRTGSTAGECLGAVHGESGVTSLLPLMPLKAVPHTRQNAGAQLTPFPPFLWSRTPAHGVVLPTSKKGLPSL